MDNIQLRGTWTFMILVFRFTSGVNTDVRNVELASRVTARKGSCAVLPCKILSSVTLSNYIWLYNPIYDKASKEFNGTVVYERVKNDQENNSFKGRVRRIGKTQNNCTIMITDLTAEDTGEYMLRMVGISEWKWMSKSNLSLEVSDSGTGLQLESVPIMTEKKEVTLTCSIEYYCTSYEINLDWVQDVNGDVKTDIRKDTYERSSTTLTFIPSWRDNNKSISCVLWGEKVENENKTIQLDVRYAPKNVKMIITPKGKQFREGTNVTFECIVNSSNPEVRNIAWFKDDKKLFVEKKAITEKDAGKYRCEAENEIGKSSSNEVVVEVLFLPKVSKPTISNDNKNKEDEEATVKCTSIEGNPKISSYDWFKDGKPYKTTERDSLYFSKLSWTDAGYYSCKARNTIGSSEESLRQYLVVQYAPKNVTVQVSPGPSVTQNTNVQLNCTAKGNAGYLHYTWYYKDEPLQNSNKDHVIRNIQVSQAGEYYCYVRNDIGSNTSPVLHLHVSHSALTKVMYTAAGIGPLIVLIIAVVIILHFRVCFRLKNCRKTNNDQSDASFFVLKKAHNEASDPQQSSSEDSLNQHINYASLQFPASSNGGQDQSRIKTNSSDPSDIYSVVRKPRSAAEYENIQSSDVTQDESLDEIHYSVITNLSKGSVREPQPEVEYAMLKH
ncbi:B-cell receptor CD22 isoform X2 [Engystomops pustulosus]|uniref:B-cell receptor CD22 isoform X2 n=1 Tax=Engystomops pustulosus TaxID=76066 RepID=UPI003AFA6A2F